MNKKILLLAVLGCAGVQSSYSNVPMRVGLVDSTPWFYSSISTEVSVSDALIKSVAAVALTYTAYKTGSYLYNRESNGIKVSRLNKLWNSLTYDMHFSNLQDVQKFLRQTAPFVRPVLDSYAEMEARYNSWAKPWNWTSEMRVAYQKAKLLSVLFRYYDIIADWSQLSSSEQALVKCMKKRNKGSSRFPLLDTVAQLRFDLETLESSLYKCGFESILSAVLDTCLDFVLSCDEYTEELRLQAVEELHARTARAAERAAWAAESTRWR